MPGLGLGIFIGNSKRLHWTPRNFISRSECYELWQITGAGNLVGLKRGDTLVVGGTAGNYTFQVPNTAPYKGYDTDKIWFKYAANIQRTATEAEMIGYDFARTIVKYQNVAPYSIEYIMILASDPATTIKNRMRDAFDLSIWWDNTLSLHGNLKGNRGTGQNVFTKEVSTLLTGLLNYYKFNETSGNLIDIVSANNGTVTGATPNQAGKINKAYSFDGNDKIVLASDHTFLTTQSFSIGLWIKPLAVNTSEYILQMNAAVAGRAELYKINANVGFKIVGSNGAGTTTVTFTNVLTTDWHHILAIRNVVTDKINLWVDGVAWDTPVTDATTANIGPFRIKLGQDQAATLPYTGSMDELGIWTKALSTDEIVELYNSGAGNTHPF